MNTGQSLLSAIPKSRLVLYAFLSSLIPVGLALFFASSTISRAKNRTSSVEDLQRQILTSIKMQEKNRLVIAQFQEKDPFYLNKTVGLYRPLRRETAVLEEIQSYGTLPNLGVHERRYRSISDNGFNFVESAATITPIFKETMEVQNKVVELDEGDLTEVLGYIEDDNQQATIRPQLIVIEGGIDRKKGYDSEVWALSMKIVKRMYTSPISKKNVPPNVQ